MILKAVQQWEGHHGSICHDGWSSIWVLYFLVIKVKADDIITYTKFLSVSKVFNWHKFWKDILDGNPFVNLSVLCVFGILLIPKLGIKFFKIEV